MVIVLLLLFFVKDFLEELYKFRGHNHIFRTKLTSFYRA